MKYSILLIEEQDHESAVLLSKLERLMNQPIEVMWCRGYEEAFGPLFSGSWDAVLMNYDLATRKNLGILRRVKALLQGKDAKLIIYHSSKNKPSLSEEVWNEGVTAVINRHEVSTLKGLSLFN